MDLEKLRKEQKDLEEKLRSVKASIALAESKDLLWRVRVRADLLVYAPDAGEACQVALANAAEEMSTKSNAVRIRSRKDVPKRWWNAVPWEGTDSYCEELSGTTVAEFFSKRG
jgi:hypothetical protein